MKRNIFQACLVGLLILVANSSAFAQCTTAVNGLYPSTTFTPTCSGFSQTITTCAYASEYSHVNLTAGNTYTFSTSVSTDIITITDDATNTVQAFGTGSAVFNCTITGLYRFYRHLSGCGAQSTCRNAYVLCGTPPPPPTNDDCATAIPVICGSTVTGSTTAAAPDGTAPACGGNVTSNGVWYSFQGTGQTVTFSLCGSSYDTYIHLYSGSCGSLSCLTSSDDYCGSASQVTYATVSGTTYYILVNGYNTSNGAFTFAVTAPAPANDDCTNAMAITPGSISGSTGCSTADVEPTCSGVADGSGGVWYSYTPNCSGSTLTASLCGSSFDTRIRVFSGTCASLTCEAGNEDFCSTQSQATWTGTGGTTYYILVYGATGAGGSFTLNLTEVESVPPVPDVASLPAINSSCAVTLTAPTATDNCAGAVTGTTAQMSYNLNGVYNVVWTYDDGNGNTSTQSQSVTINDNVPPVAMLPNDTTIYVDPGQCCATFTYGSASGAAVDQVGNNMEDGWNISPLYSSADDFIVPPGATWTITDATFDAFTSLPLPSSIDVYFYNDAGGYPGSVVATDNITSGNYTATIVGTNFGLDDYHYTFTLNTPVTLNAGTYWIAFQENGAGALGPYWEVSSLGAYGNNALQVSGPISSANWASAPINSGADHVYSLSITGTPLFADACGGPVNITQGAGSASGSCLPVGVTTNTFTGTDENGNATTASFTITVMDNQNPIPTTDSVETFTFTTGTTSIFCPDYTTTLDTLQVSGLPAVLSSGDIGSVCININHTFDGDLTISLVSPLGTSYVLSATNGGGGANYTNTCFDMDALMNINAGSPPFNGSFIPEGAGGFDAFNGENPNGTWKLSVYDGSGGDQGTIIDFTINFTIHHPDMLPSVHGSCAASVTAPTASDNCGTTITGTTTDPTSYSTDGNYTVTWTYTDVNGNTTTQTQLVAVDDVGVPVPDATSLPIVTNNCSVTLTAIPTATDSCEGAITATTIDALTYNVAGTYTVTWTYDDGRGNTTTQTQTVIVTDNTAPVPNVTVLPNVTGNCSVTVSTPPTATDNCAGVIDATTTDPLTYPFPGTFLIIWHYDDGNGNTWTQNQTVVVNGCLGIEDESGQWSALVYPNPGSGIFTVSLSEMPTVNTEVRLVDALGQVLYAGMLQGQIQTFDFSHLASATYYLLITNENSHISKPVIIRHDY